MMKKIITLVFLILMLNPLSSFALIASGVGTTKENALKEAKTNIINNALSQYLSGKAYKKKQEGLNKLYENIDTYLFDVELLSEEKKEGLLRVTIEANINETKLKRFLSKKEGWIAQKQDNRLALFIQRTSRSHLSGRSYEGRSTYWEFKSILEDEFGYDVIRNSLIERKSRSSQSTRRSRAKVKTMDRDDALEMAAEMGAEHAVLFDIKVDRIRDRRTHTLRCELNLTLYDTLNNEKIDSVVIQAEGAEDLQPRARQKEIEEATLNLLFDVIDQAAMKVHAMLNQDVAGTERIIRYNLVLKKFKNEEIQSIVKEFNKLEEFTSLRPLQQSSRTYKAQIRLTMNRNLFLREIKRILNDANLEHILNFNRNKIFITKKRIHQKEERKTNNITL